MLINIEHLRFGMGLNKLKKKKKGKEKEVFTEVFKIYV